MDYTLARAPHMARCSRTRGGTHFEVPISSPLLSVKNSRQYLPAKHLWREGQLVHLKGRAWIDKSLPKSPSLDLQALSLGGQETFRTPIATPEGEFELPPSTREVGHWVGMLLFESICQSHMPLSLQHPINKSVLNIWAGHKYKSFFISRRIPFSRYQEIRDESPKLNENGNKVQKPDRWQ